MGIPDDPGGDISVSSGPQVGLYLLEPFLQQMIDCYVMMKVALVNWCLSGM